MKRSDRSEQFERAQADLQERKDGGSLFFRHSHLMRFREWRGKVSSFILSPSAHLSLLLDFFFSPPSTGLLFVFNLVDLVLSLTQDPFCWSTEGDSALFCDFVSGVCERSLSVEVSVDSTEPLSLLEV